VHGSANFADAGGNTWK